MPDTKPTEAKHDSYTTLAKKLSERWFIVEPTTKYSVPVEKIADFLRAAAPDANELVKAVTTLRDRLALHLNGEAHAGSIRDVSLIQMADDVLSRHPQSRAASASEGQTATGKHVLYTNADADRPRPICDPNGEVVLSMCKLCGKAESELDEPCTPPAPSQTPSEATPLQCQCADWAVEDMTSLLLGNGHNPRCDKWRGNTGAVDVIKALVKGMRDWGAEEDGIPDFCWEAYRKGVFVTTGQFPPDQPDFPTVTPPAPGQTHEQGGEGTPKKKTCIRCGTEVPGAIPICTPCWDRAHPDNQFASSPVDGGTLPGDEEVKAFLAKAFIDDGLKGGDDFVAGANACAILMLRWLRTRQPSGDVVGKIRGFLGRYNKERNYDTTNFLADVIKLFDTLPSAQAPAAPKAEGIIECNGKRYRKTGEVRLPKEGEMFLADGFVDTAYYDFANSRFPIVTPLADGVETKNGDAK